ncbi:carbon-nitrogen hydrolase family protein [Myxococcota bacterium]|nr:carbon-nitrogen hydrolase family protein [Myxococcota bacterium]
MRTALVQCCSTDDVDRNLADTREAVQEAVRRGASLVALPENFAYMRREGAAFPCAEESGGPLAQFLGSLAREHRIWLIGGSLPEKIPGDSRVYNTSLVFSPEGEEIARYRKIHLFDVDLGEDQKEVYRESHHFAPGRTPVTAETPFGSIGLSICYDLRFPELYRHPALCGAQFLTVPSAFMPQTGLDHWEILLRARAIEAQAFVLAPAQCGQHTPDRASFGHSMIIDPWGRILAEAGDSPTVIDADCDLAEAERIRSAIPALRHRRLD